MDVIRRWSASLLVGVAALMGCSEGPEDSVRSLGKAFHDQDRLRVTRYMDVDRTAASASAVFVAEATKGSGHDSAGSATELGGVLGTAMIGAMQPAITAYVRQLIYYMADSTAPTPNFMGETTSSAQPKRTELRDSLASRVPEVRSGRTEGDVALVPVFFPATGGQTDSGTVEFRLERAGKNWRVVGIERFPEAVFSRVKTKMR